MFGLSNKIIMIDDSLDDLNQLSEVFRSNGIGCRTFLYDSFYNSPLNGVKVAFFDINLSSASSDNQRNSTLQDAISNYIHEDNGPFVLIFWTNNIQWVESFKEYINRGCGDKKLFKRTPIYIANVDKKDFYDHHKSLEDKISTIFNSPFVKLLFEYEELMAESISKAMSQIIDIIPKSSIWGDNTQFEKNCQEVFSTIAVQTVGYSFAKEDPDRAIKESMIPVFSNSFMHNKTNLWNEALTILKESKKAGDICFPENFKEAKMNSIFNIDFENKYSTNDRGAVCPILDTEELFSDKFDCKFADWFSVTFPDVKKKERNDSRIICVEFSAACDYSNKKKRTNKYLLGAMLPVSALQDLENSKNKGDYLFLIRSKFEIETKEKVIAFNLNYSFTTSLSDKGQLIGEPMFGFKKEMMDMIGNRYANHVSRIGITSFK